MACACQTLVCVYISLQVLNLVQITPAIDAAIYRPNSPSYQLQPSFHPHSTEPEPTARARKDIIKRAIDHEISISDDEIIAYISKKRNNQIKSKTWITYVELKITEESELKEIVRKHMETLLGVTDDEVKKA